jgi:hypothetical protein
MLVLLGPMKSFDRFLCKYFLPRILSRNCGNRIPRSGKEGENINCFSTHLDLDQNRGAFFWVRSIAGDTLAGFEWDGTSFSIPKTIELSDVNPNNLFIVHYYGLSEIRYSGIRDLAFGRVTLGPYIKVNAINTLGRLDQYFFNKKKLVTKARVELLQLLVQKHLDGRLPASSLEIMTYLYSSKWVLHPSGDAQRKKLRLYLDSLVLSGELDLNVNQYSVSPKALVKIEEYEEAERKHTENVKMQRRMFWVAFLVALLTCAQAGVIKLPTLIDWSSAPTTKK